MSYLALQMLSFMLLAGFLGFAIGWLLSGSRYRLAIEDLDKRWRMKLGEVEGERDRLFTELEQSNQTRSKSDAVAGAH